MSADIYDRLKAALDDKLIPTFLRPATITRTVPGTVNPSTMLTTDSTQVLPCDAVARVRKTRLDNGVLHSDTVVTLTVAPQIGDRITQGSATYKVQAIETVAPVGTAMLFRAVVTR